MAGDTDWLNKEESQFMRGTGNIVRFPHQSPALPFSFFLCDSKLTKPLKPLGRRNLVI